MEKNNLFKKECVNNKYHEIYQNTSNLSTCMISRFPVYLLLRNEEMKSKKKQCI